MPTFNGELKINGTKLIVEIDTPDIGEIYLGADNAGVNGDNSLGIRNNSGTMQMKQKAGNWFDILNPPTFNVGGVLTAGGNIIPDTDDAITIGSATKHVQSIYLSSSIICDSTFTLTVNGQSKFDVDGTGTVTIDGEEFKNGKWDLNGTAIYYSSGNVGIGTSSPDVGLHVRASGGIEIDGDNDAVLRWSADGTDKWYLWNDNDLSGVSDVLRLDAGTIGATKVAFLPNGNVGIGTTSPSATGHIYTGASGFSGSLSTNFDEFCLEGSGNVGMTLISTNVNNGGIAFADEDSNFRGGIIYQHSTDGLSFWTDGSERLSIDSSGSLGIGTSDPKTTFHSTGTTIVGVGTAAQADSDLSAGQVNVWVDETGNTLNFKVKYSNGTTVKSGSISLT